MLGIMNHVIRSATRRAEGGRSPFDREYHIQYEELVRRREAEAEMHRHLRRGWPLL